MVPYATLLIPLYVLLNAVGPAELARRRRARAHDVPAAVLDVHDAHLVRVGPARARRGGDGRRLLDASRALWRVLLPAVKPGLITVGLFAFLAAWNDFMAPLILINDTNRMTLPLAVVEPARAGAGRRRLRRHRGRRRRARAAVHRALPASSNGTTCAASCPAPSRDDHDAHHDHHRTPCPWRRPPGALRPLGLDEVRDHRRVLGRRQEVNGARDPRAHRALARARGLARATSTSRPPGACPRGAAGASSPTPRSTSTSRRWPGRSAARGDDRRSRRGSARSSPGSPRRRSPTATSTRGSAGPARSRAGPTSSGATSCTASGTCSRRPSPGRARGPTPTTGSSRSRAAPPTSCATCSATGGIESICGHAEVEVGLAELGRATGRAALPRAGAAVHRAPRPGHARATSSGAARTSRTTSPVREADVLRGHAVRANYLVGRRGRRRRRDRRRRAARRAATAVGRTPSRAAPT